MMEVIKNAAVSAVTQVVTPAKPESFDLIGLTADQVAIIFVLTGETSGNANGLSELYGATRDALGATWEALPNTKDVMQGSSLGPLVTDQLIESVLRHKR